MALVAQLIDIGNIHQPRILRAMWGMAAQAALTLHSRMFKHKGSARLRMALTANSILVGCRPDVVVAEGSVDVVAVAALDQALIHLVVEGLRER